MEEKKPADQATNQEVKPMSSTKSETSDAFAKVLKNQLASSPALMIVGSK